MSWRRISVIAGAIAGLLGLGAFALPIVRSDPPPWASVDTVRTVKATLNRNLINDKNDTNDMLQELRGDIKATLIEPLHSRECEARRAHDTVLAQAFADRLADYQIQYREITGHDYPLPPCP